MPISSQLLRPVSFGFILLTFLLAMLFNLAPWQAALQGLTPDFIALMLVYWALHQPKRIGVGWAFSLGLLMDVADGNYLGQHALAYSVIACLTLIRQRQFAIFPFWQQALITLFLLLLAQCIMLLVRLLFGDSFPGLGYFAGAPIAAILWTPLSNLMLMHQRKPVADDL
ncbi:rod shape-determining protein MreD [Chitinilyticum piscinae]|uniref:Rod shape-determining protein MreD n=1 Tax=Chitinilyticum piscinae TaxID=2866724 RepID=A0A8J7K1U2_9NEIS|nr:rod shape-determining protein MreD [Chitinilyticum piscinae]MBE9609097.1 rod shape-determining protein MreD [Chitinilyticum piscinae]